MTKFIELSTVTRYVVVWLDETEEWILYEYETGYPIIAYLDETYAEYGYVDYDLWCDDKGYITWAQYDKNFEGKHIDVIFTPTIKRIKLEGYYE